MKKFIPYEKLSKKEKRRVDEIKRRSWLGINPVTRIADTDRKNYKRKSKHPEKYEEKRTVNLRPFILYLQNSQFYCSGLF